MNAKILTSIWIPIINRLYSECFVSIVAGYYFFKWVDRLIGGGKNKK